MRLWVGWIGISYNLIVMRPLPKVIIELYRTIPPLNTTSWEPPKSLQMCSTTIDVVKPQPFIAITQTMYLILAGCVATMKCMKPKSVIMCSNNLRMVDLIDKVRLVYIHAII